MSLTIAELRTLDRLLQEALDLPHEARATWIDALPAPHDTLAPLLRAHLLQERDSDGVETADFLDALPTFSSPASRDGDPAIGERVGPYKLVHMLGEGGMSSVWLAERVDGTLRREVALKLPHRHLLDRGLAARMQRERDILAGLNDDHIARLYDAGVDTEGRPWLALEYVAGVPINTFCADTKMDLNGRLRLMVQVVRAVAHAHASLVVHRDLKPGNILVTTGDSAPRVKLLDFGIAKLLEREDQPPGAPDLTQTLGRALTPDYASPEQLLEQPVTTSSDIYSLGVVLYEVVTGEKPYKLKRQTAQALADAVIHADVTRPSKRSAAGARAIDARRIEGDLDAIILKALKAAPAERYATASALADDLERFLARQPVLAQPDSLGYRTRRFLQRHALASSAAAAVSIALIAGIAVALWQAREARLETAKTKAVKDFLLSIISVSNIDEQDALRRRKQPIGDMLLDAVKSMPGRFADQPEVRSEVQAVLSEALSNLSMDESAKAIQEARLAELNARGAPLLERMQAQVALAITLGDTSDFKRTPVLLQEAIDAIAGRTDPPARQLAAQALHNMAMTKIQRHDGSSGVPDAERAVQIAESAVPGSKTHITALSLLGYAHAFQQDMPSAEIAFKKAVALAEKLPEADRGAEASLRLRYGEALMVTRFHMRALTELSQGLKVIEQTTGNESFRWARTAILVANLKSSSGDAPGAIALFEQVIRVYEKFGKELDPLFISAAHAMLAQCLVDYGLLAEAQKTGQLGFEPFRGKTDMAPAALWLAASRYAYVLQVVGDYAQSDKIFHDAFVVMRANKLARNSDQQSGERLLALNNVYRGRHAEAQAVFKELIALDTNPVKRYATQSNFARQGLARSYLDQGALDEAESVIDDIAKVVANLAEDEVAISRGYVAQFENLQGSLKLKRGDAPAAAAHFQRGIDLLVPRLHPSSPVLASARADLAIALLRSGDRTKAKSLVDQARAAMAQHAAVGVHLTRSVIHAEQLLAHSPR